MAVRAAGLGREQPEQHVGYSTVFSTYVATYGGVREGWLADLGQSL